MKNLFQNKKNLLITLILMASCLGILGVGGKIFAGDTSDMQCGGYSECTGLFTTDCRRDCSFWQTPYTICGALNSTCECKCDDTCADNYCKNDNQTLGICTSSSVVHCITCLSSCCYDANSRLTGLGKSGQYFCKEQLFCKSDNIQNCPNGCDMLTGECKAASSTNCTSVGTQECLDITKCKSVNTITSGPTDCPGNLVCCERGSCVSKTTAVCTDGCEEFNRRYCENERWYTDTNSSRTKYCSNCNHCGDGDCNCGETTTSCSADCGAPPAPIVPVIPQPPTGGGGISDTGPSTDPGASGGAVRFTNPLSTNSFEALVMGIINWILGIVVSLAILFLIIGGLMYIVSAGDEERIKKAKNIILYAVVGLGVVILSWSIITELKDILGVR